MIDAAESLREQGFVLLTGVFSTEEISSFLEHVHRKLSEDSEGIKTLAGDTYAARSVLQLIPRSITFWQKPVLIEFLAEVLGLRFGLVRGLYFDKHPQRTWSLGWHKDMTIAVAKNDLPSSHFSKPTTKSGIPHVKAPEHLLSQMLTLRIHLDDVTDENGPLEVIPQSHLSGKSNLVSTAEPVKIKCSTGDTLAMRPLLSHASGSSDLGTKLHRRILHLEFASTECLPDHFQWFDFIRPEGDVTESTFR